MAAGMAEKEGLGCVRIAFTRDGDTWEELHRGDIDWMREREYSDDAPQRPSKVERDGDVVVITTADGRVFRESAALYDRLATMLQEHAGAAV